MTNTERILKLWIDPHKQELNWRGYYCDVIDEIETIVKALTLLLKEEEHEE